MLVRLLTPPTLIRDRTDLNLAAAAGKAATVPLPLGGLTTTLYNTINKHEEFADKDFSVVFEYLRIAMEGGLVKS